MIDLGDGVQLITRAEWGARPPRSRTQLTASVVTSHWEGPHMGTFPHASCAAKVRGIQAFHMDARGWSDIAYNTIACPHRYVFEGRGRDVRSAANGTTAGNNAAYACCYLGGEGDPFTPDGAAAMRVGGDWLTRRGSARNCHRDWKQTACPGDPICSWTKAGQPITAAADPQPEDWSDMATKAEVAEVVQQELGEFAARRFDDGGLVLREALGRGGAGIRKLEAQNAAILAAIAGLDVTVDVDEDALADALADAIPLDIADRVIDRLHERTAPRS